MGRNAGAAAPSGGALTGSHSKKKKTVSSKNIAAQAVPGRQARRERLKLYAWTAALAGVMVAVMFLSRGIHPYGENVLRYTGDGAQYFGILGSVQRALLTDDNILFSWSTVLGGNMMGIFAYYAASPFNLLTVFFPDNLMAAYHLIFALKFVSAAVCFAVMLRNMFPEADRPPILLFSVSYPFIGFMTYYAWNQSWMDGIILLPLVLLGIWQIVQSRKPLLYTITLSIALLANYYTGYIIVLGSVLLFICTLVLSRPAGRAEIVKTCLWFAGATITAAALSAWLLLPTYAALPAGRARSLQELIDGIGYRSMPAETLSMLFTAPYSNMNWWDNYPVIFTGIVQLVLVVLFFVNGEIRRRYKAAAAVLFAVFAISFAVSLLNTVWHGFSQTMWFNHRYSFLVSFLIELVAFYSFLHVQGVKTKLLLAGGLIAGLILVACSTDKKNVGAGTLLLDVVLICAVLAVLYAYLNAQSSGNRKRQKVLFSVIAGITACSLLVNAYLSLKGVSDADSLEVYQKAQTTDEQIAEAIDDDGFYRVGSTWRYGNCDPLRVGYAGVENFASPENPEAVEAVSRLGVRYGEWRSYYGDNVPLSSDALLGLKYIVTGNQHKGGRYAQIGQVPEAGLYVYENPYALPVVFPGETLYSSEGAELDRFEYMNEYWNSISDEGGNMFEAIDVSWEETPTDEGYDVRVAFTAPFDGPVYAFIPKGDVTVDSPVEPGLEHQDVFYVGEYTAGQEGELMLHVKDSYNPEEPIVFYAENMDALAAKSAAVQKHDLQIEEISGSELFIQYTAEEDGFLTSTIPFDEGWNVYVDGLQVGTYRNMDSYLAFDVPAGEHDIELVYWPPYFTAGVWMSVSALAAVLAYAYILHRKRRAAAKEAPAGTAADPPADRGHSKKHRKKAGHAAG